MHLKVSLGTKDINETFGECKRGDVLPPGRPLLRIAAIFDDRVKFEPVDGYSLVGADRKTFEVWTGKPASQSIGKGGHTTVCSVSVLRIGSAEAGGSSDAMAPLGLAAGHSIEVLEIGANNGVPSASFEVDGTVYAAEEIGQSFTTDWGQIEVLGVDDVAHTVTIEHGDLQETLRLGRPVSQ